MTHGGTIWSRPRDRVLVLVAAALVKYLFFESLSDLVDVLVGLSSWGFAATLEHSRDGASFIHACTRAVEARGRIGKT